MGTTRGDIRLWIDRAKAEGATHMLVVCDTYDYTDYPVSVKPDQDAREVFKRYDGPNMAKVMEVYDLRIDTEAQLTEHRAFHF